MSQLESVHGVSAVIMLVSTRTCDKACCCVMLCSGSAGAPLVLTAGSTRHSVAEVHVMLQHERHTDKP